MNKVTVIGAGLAGSEAAWQIAQRGIQVDLFEMRPRQLPPAHQTGLFAELVCSNSLRAAAIENAVGLLKEEMRCFDSLIMLAADHTRIPAGGALAVDRVAFSEFVTQKIRAHPNVNVINEEIVDISDFQVVVIASGPLTSQSLSEEIARHTGQQYLYFYDAAAPIVTAESLDLSIIYQASRYGKGDADYLNCPMTKEQYEYFWHELITAETTAIKQFEREIFFEGCMPVEVMAKRGPDTLRFGPLKPVGLVDPRSDQLPYAVVQLRQDNAAGTLYNLVGFQTHLKWPEQQRVFRLIPGLQNAEFVRYGVMHRNTYINSPILLTTTMQMSNNKKMFFAGQITGVEGYVESAASGLIAGINAAFVACDKLPISFPKETAHGSLINYITNADPANFQPMNVNFGLLPPLERKIRDKKQKNLQLSQRSMQILQKFKEKCDNILAQKLPVC